MGNLTDEQINLLTQNKELVEAIRKERTEERKEKQKNQSIERLKRLVKRNPHLISIDMNKAKIRNTTKLSDYCKKMGYKIFGNIIDINPEPEEKIDPIEKLTKEKLELTEKKESYERIIASITKRLDDINEEVLDHNVKKQQESGKPLPLYKKDAE